MRRDNAQLKVDAENAVKYKSAFNSNEASIRERIEMTEKLVADKNREMEEV